MKRSLALLATIAITACSGTGHVLPPQHASGAGTTRAVRDYPTGMPGDYPTALPGASLVCVPVATAGQASCTLAINLSLPALASPTTPASLIPGFQPADLRSAYAIPQSATGGTIAVVIAYDAPLVEADLGVYRATFGLPPCTIASGCLTKLNEQGAAGPYPLPDAGWAQEAALDLEVASAICAQCRLVLVEAGSASMSDLAAAVDAAAGLGARAISNSYYAAEWAGESALEPQYHHPGIAITASSGDAEWPSYPAASSGVIAVGGTSLTRGPSGWSESAWTYGGGGCSAQMTRPAWQPPACGEMRAAVDVAAVADPQTGVAMYASASGGWVVAGGTSVGAPLVAAAAALSSTIPSPATPYLNPAAFRDVAPAGFDVRTGIGSPDGIAGL